MLLRNVSICLTAGGASKGVLSDRLPCDIEITANLITRISENIHSSSHSPTLSFSNALAIPGLINSHDHLDFNLYPQFGDKTYTNYTQWGPYIWKRYRSEIIKTQLIPASMRARWGMYKNLLAGVTTVAHHGDKVEIVDPLITVLQNAQSLHSVKFEKLWKLRLNNFLRPRRLCVIHAGEGTDGEAVSEIDELLRWNLLKRKLVAVHAVAMTPVQAKKFEAVIWCPVSNYFLLGKTAAIRELKPMVNICFGTDSTLTAGWNVWDHLRSARSSGLVSDSELYEMLTVNPASLWKTNCGVLEAGRAADIVIAEADDFYSIDPSKLLLVMHRGEIILFDESVDHQPETAFDKIDVSGRIKYVAGGITNLMFDIHRYNPDIQFPVTPL